MDRVRDAPTPEEFIREMEGLLAAQDCEFDRLRDSKPPFELPPMTTESIAETMRLRERELRCREIAREAIERARAQKAGA